MFSIFFLGTLVFVVLVAGRWWTGYKSSRIVPNQLAQAMAHVCASIEKAKKRAVSEGKPDAVECLDALFADIFKCE